MADAGETDVFSGNLTAAQRRRSSRTGQARRVVVLLLPSRGHGLKGRLKDRPQKSCRSIDDPTPARGEFNFLGRPRTEFLVGALFFSYKYSSHFHAVSHSTLPPKVTLFTHDGRS